MKILQFCHKSPYPAIEGGPIAVNNITNSLLDAGHYVKVFALSTPKFKIDINNIPAEYKDKTYFEFEYVDTTVKPLKALLNIFTDKSYNIERFISDNVSKKLISILNRNQFDIIQLESLFVSSYLDIIRKHSQAKVVLREHNIEYLIWERLSSKEKNPLKKSYLHLLANRLKKYECEMLNKYDGIACITVEDKRKYLSLGCKVPITDIGFGINPDKYIGTNPGPVNPSVFFIGSMDWLPNIEGIKWFLENVWQKISTLNKNLQLHLAGRNFPAWMLNLNMPDVVVHGEVPDAIEFMNSGNIMIVPLLSGSGVRIKIIEAMALGKTVISTSVGAEGINYTDGNNIIIANSTEDFIKAIQECLADNDKNRRIGENARKLINEEHNSKRITLKLLDFYKKLLN